MSSSLISTGKSDHPGLSDEEDVFAVDTVLSDAEKAHIVRSFFDLADAVMDEVRDDIEQSESLSLMRIGELIDKHSQPGSARHMKNIWRALQYLVDASLDERAAAEEAARGTVTTRPGRPDGSL
ncbi:hypothetical protein [uncultured Roseobacter sp.]|uniref:hypothetical protein n=1 Tax=uncultured Roseobacter sp. TaxID=114847 RepID=UPI00262A998E|nr:hypothetical protein [uncultured Roseobacter sp.]